MRRARSSFPLFISVAVFTALGGALALYAFGRTESQARGSGEGPVLVELFTSEGCSSCPPADELLMELELDHRIGKAEVIVLGEHVDYWNHLGWADPFSSARFSERQDLYARRFGIGSVYTPQMIIDGRLEVIGSDKPQVLQAIEEASKAPKAAVTIKSEVPRDAGDPQSISLSVDFGKFAPLPKGETADILLAITEGPLHSRVSLGENAGRLLSHVAVARVFEVLGQLDPAHSPSHGEWQVRLDPGWNLENLKSIVFVQERDSGRILGAASARLSPAS